MGIASNANLKSTTPVVISQTETPRKNESVVEESPRIIVDTPVTPTKPNRPRVEEDDFGLPDRLQGAAAPFIEASIIRIQTNANRVNYLELDNGQVWRETEKGRLRFKIGQKVRIESGLLSSYKLKVVGKKLSVKVKRLK